MQYTTAFDIGKRKRESGGINEDSVAVNLLEEGHRDADRRAGVFVLADGAGGAKAGDVASYVVTVEVTRRLTEKLWNTRRLGEVVDAGASEHNTMGTRGLSEAAVADPLADLTDDGIHVIIEEAIQESHQHLIEVINEYDLDSAYSTVVAGVKIGNRFHYGWVGDSRAYVVNVAEERDDDQRVSLLTKDHSVVERLVNEGKIDEVEAYVHRRGNRVTRALGGTYGEDPATSRVDVDTNSVQLFGDDILLITSDGLIDAYTGAPELHKQYEEADDTAEIEETILEKSVTDDEIRDVILDADSLEAAAQRFVDLSNERGGKDNVSLILFRDHYLPRSSTGGLPIRHYDPAPEEIYDWETVLMRSEDEPEPAVASPETPVDATAGPEATSGTTPQGPGPGTSPEADAEGESGADAEEDAEATPQVGAGGGTGTAGGSSDADFTTRIQRTSGSESGSDAGETSEDESGSDAGTDDGAGSDPGDAGESGESGEDGEDEDDEDDEASTEHDASAFEFQSFSSDGDDGD